MNGGIIDRIEATKYYKKAAELGSSSAINSLGLLVESQNKEEAITLYR
jgi:TPR repeat protein